MADHFSDKVDFIVRTDGLLKDYIESVVVKAIKAEMPDDIFKQTTPNHIRAALMLRTLQPCSLKEFAIAMRLSKAAASAQVDRMVKAGTVLREVNPENRREVLLMVSPALEEHVAHVHSRMIRWFGSIIEQLGQETLEKWYDVMVSLNEVLKQRITNGDTAY